MDERKRILEPGRLWRGSELWQTADAPPSETGLYAWYFLEPPPGVPVSDCHRWRDGTLLYVGISPSSSQSKANLRKRLRQHFRGNARGSTFRKTVGCLLQNELRLDYRRVSPKSLRFTGESESRLSAWIEENARVAWATTPEPWVMEERLIEELSLPLNLKGNEDHPFHLALSVARKAMKDEAERKAIWKASSG